MECGLCSQSHSNQRSFHCVTCARNAVYGPRVQHAHVLIEKDHLSREIERLTSANVEDDQTLELNEPSSRWVLEKRRNAILQSQHRAAALQEHRKSLANSIAKMKEELSQRRAILGKRRSALDMIQSTVPQRRREIVTRLDDKVKQREEDLELNHMRTKESRAFLAREAAALMRLRHVRTEKRGKLLDFYSIGGIFIPDLREINNTRPEELTTALTNLAHLLVLTSHYLAVRLPAEITLPHRAYPLPTIFSPAQSYSSKDIPFPGTSSSQSSSSSILTGRHDQAGRPIPRARPLYIEQKLPKVAHDDPNQYNHFIEGVSLLAWDLAWLCRTQGFFEGTESWEGICCVGKNIYQLLTPRPSWMQSAKSDQRSDERTDLQKAGPSETPPSSNDKTLRRQKSLGHLGKFSHGSAHFFLGSLEGHSLFRGWRYSRFSLIVDHLKKTLLGEMTGAEWELLDEKEFADSNQETTDGETVIIEKETTNDMEGKNDRPRGVSGWTKVRERSS